MFITKKKHDAIVESWRNRVWSESNLADRYMVERDKALAELSAIKIEANRRLAPLMAANAARTAAAKRKAKGGEG